MNLNINGYKCKKCGELHYPNRTLCRKCGFNEFDIEPLPTCGKLVTFTHLYTLAVDFDRAKISLGIVELTNGIRLIGQLDINKPRIGMNVRGNVDIVRKKEHSKYYGLIFSAA